MKRAIILGCMFLAAVTFSAQEVVQKNVKTNKNTKVEVVNPIKPEVLKKEYPVYRVTPVAETNFETSRSRASKSAIRNSKGKSSNQNKIEPTSKPEINKPSKSSARASKAAIRASKDKSSNESKLEKSNKEK